MCFFYEWIADGVSDRFVLEFSHGKSIHFAALARGDRRLPNLFQVECHVVGMDNSCPQRHARQYSPSLCLLVSSVSPFCREDLSALNTIGRRYKYRTSIYRTARCALSWSCVGRRTGGRVIICQSACPSATICCFSRCCLFRCVCVMKQRG